MSTPGPSPVESLIRQIEALSPDDRSEFLRQVGARWGNRHRAAPGSEKDADDWIRTIRRRAEEIRSGAAKTVPLDEALHSLRELRQ